MEQREEIISKLKELEKEYKIKFLWAIESGSRAWEFASEDSDFDVRCMHVGNAEDYLGLFPPKSQINFSDGKLDIESWDIKKFAELTLKSNPQIAEWLRSPVIYIDSDVKENFRKLFEEGCSLEFLRAHYLRMAKQNYHKYIDSGMSHHSCKKYLYILRAIACANYIEQKNKLPPLPYKEVIQYLPEKVRVFFEKCVVEKNKTEKATILKNNEVLDYIENKIRNLPKKETKDFGVKKKLNEYVIKMISKKRWININNLLIVTFLY